MKQLVYLLAIFVLVMVSGCITINQPGTTSPGQQQAAEGKPSAYIDLISPTSAPWGAEVRFTGHGTPVSGSITAYRWRSTVDGDVGNQSSFATTTLSPGKHIVLFSVQDGSGNWSLETQGTVNITTDSVSDGGGADPGAGGAEPPAPTPPVINTFGASPPGIIAGNTSTLSWDVANATTVTVDNGIGSVSLSGSRVVSPLVDTVYTLTAANTAFYGTATAKVTVTGLVAMKPDLIIEDIWKSGDKLYYRIKNQGTASSPVTWSEVKIDGVIKAQDAVAALAPGAIATRFFAGFVYACSGVSDTVVVTADTAGAAGESNEANNSLTKSLSCLVLGPVAPVGPLLALKPDLIVTNISFNPAPIAKVSCTVKNDGTLNAGGFDVKLYVGGILKDTSHVAALNAGATTTVNFLAYHHICVVGSHVTVKAEADSGGAVNESDETNNSRSEWWGCPPL